MIFSLHIIGAPYSKQASQSAYYFAKAALSKGHAIKRIFFSSDGVHSSSSFTIPPQDEINISANWAKLAVDHEIDLVICIAAAQRRGLLNKTEASRYGIPHHNVDSPFTLSGLGQLVEAAVESDRLITFG
ncbi:MAG: sulfurtransferase complex subunit TusD [Pseudomonadales bacterium]|nr:sulfurtransferase complex subunit TusD [Pseudomonadales bacterium]